MAARTSGLYRFCMTGGQAPAGEYDYDRYLFTENWEIKFKDTPDNNLILIQHVDNGTKIVFDKDGFLINDINGNYFLGGKTNGADSNNAIAINGDVLLALKPFVDWVGKLLTELINLKILGNMGTPASVFLHDLILI